MGGSGERYSGNTLKPAASILLALVLNLCRSCTRGFGLRNSHTEHNLRLMKHTRVNLANTGLEAEQVSHYPGPGKPLKRCSWVESGRPGASGNFPQDEERQFWGGGWGGLIIEMHLNNLQATSFILSIFLYYCN